MPHSPGPRREDRHVRSPLPLQLELGFLHALPNLVVRDIETGFARCGRRILERLDLALSIFFVRLRRRCVMAVTIDDHDLPFHGSSGPSRAVVRLIMKPTRRLRQHGFFPVFRRQRLPAPFFGTDCKGADCTAQACSEVALEPRANASADSRTLI